MPTLLDVCSFLGMGRAREGESGEEEEGGGAGCQVCGPLESADSWWGWRPVPWNIERNMADNMMLSFEMCRHHKRLLNHQISTMTQ